MTMKLKALSDLKSLLPDKDESTSLRPALGHNGEGKTVHVVLDTKGRKGKAVTLISGLQHSPDTMKEIARILKEYCATGGTVKGLMIELQGDQRVRAGEKLSTMNYVVKGA